LSVNWYDDWEDVVGVWQENDGVFGKDDFFDFVPVNHDAIVFALAKYNLFAGEIKDEIARVHVGKFFDVVIDAEISMKRCNESENWNEKEWEEFIIKP